MKSKPDTRPTQKQTQTSQQTNRPRRIALYVIYDKDGVLDGFRRYYIEQLRRVVDTIVAVVSGDLTPQSRKELRGLVDEAYYRENTGLLAGAWIDGIQHVGWDKLYEYDELLMLNDSFFGPFYPIEEFFDAMEESDADFYGVMKNFEKENYTEIAGRKMKHGHFRGSICYFYVIKRNLLHSEAFRKYWSQMPEVKEDWDTYFFAEIEFYDYVIDNGFKVDAFQSDRLKGYFFDNLTHNMERHVRDDRIPYARIRPFCTDLKDQSLSIGYADDPRRTLDFIDKHTGYDTNLIWDYILRAKNLTHIWQQLQLEYVVSRDCVEHPYTYDKPIAVILHIYYEDQVALLADYCINFPPNTKFFITTIEDGTLKTIRREFDKRKLDYVVQTRRNVGVAMSTLWVTYADVVTGGDYEYICYFHDKKSPYSEFLMQGERFANRCFENLFGTPEVVRNIINVFEENPRMGMAGPPMVYHGEYFTAAHRGWAGNYENTVNLAKKLDVHVNINPEINPVSAYGDMFWFRAAALKKAIGHHLTFDDFAVEYSRDFTFMHAIERIYGFLVQDAGYYYADVINSDQARSDLVNYQAILYSITDIMIKDKQWPATYTWTKYVIDEHLKADFRAQMDQEKAMPGAAPLSEELVVKNYFKKKIPGPVWTVIKKIYHLFGGKKWVG